MKRVVLKRVSKVICMAVAVMCLLGGPVLNVSASDQVEEMSTQVFEVPEGYFDDMPNARNVFSGCRLSASFSSAGMHITAFTGSHDISPLLGAKDIVVEQKVWYGWKVVATSDGGEIADTCMVAVQADYTGAVKGETYRVSCVHYGDLTYDGVENIIEHENDTGSFVFTY